MQEPLLDAGGLAWGGLSHCVYVRGENVGVGVCVNKHPSLMSVSQGRCCSDSICNFNKYSPVVGFQGNGGICIMSNYPWVLEVMEVSHSLQHTCAHDFTRRRTHAIHNPLDSVHIPDAVFPILHANGVRAYELMSSLISSGSRLYCTALKSFAAMI